MYIWLYTLQVEPEYAEEGAAGVQVAVDVLADHLPRVPQHVRARHRAPQPTTLARRVPGQEGNIGKKKI